MKKIQLYWLERRYRWKRNQTLIIHCVGSRKRKKNYKESLYRLYLTGHHLIRGKANTNRADISLGSLRMYSPSVSIWSINMTMWINQRTYSLYVVLGTYQVCFHDSLKSKMSSTTPDKVFPIFSMNHSNDILDKWLRKLFAKLWAFPKS